MSETPDKNIDESDQYGDFPYGDARGRVYRAVRGKRCPHLRFVPHKGGYRRQLPFHDIRNTWIRDDGREIRLDFSHLSVIIFGKNLLTVASAIGAHDCSCIEAFNPAEHDTPDERDPLIDGIGYWSLRRPSQIEDLDRRRAPRKNPLAMEPVSGA